MAHSVSPDGEQFRLTIGKNCKLRNNVSVYKGVTLEDGVFCGPSMVFTNIYNPRAEIRKMDQVRPTLVKHGATLGANCVLIATDHDAYHYPFILEHAPLIVDARNVYPNPAATTGKVFPA